jgi:hypothetical protein
VQVNEYLGKTGIFSVIIQSRLCILLAFSCVFDENIAKNEE